VGEGGDGRASGLGGEDALADSGGALEGVDALGAVVGLEPVGELLEGEAVVAGECAQAEFGVEKVGEEEGGIRDWALGIRGAKRRRRRPGAPALSGMAVSRACAREVGRGKRRRK
jgi:hypothetical protein